MISSSSNVSGMVSLKSYLNQLYHASKVSANRKHVKGRLEAGQHNISLEYLEELWQKQCGRCYYSSIPMRYNQNEWKVSLERLDPSQGYTRDNVVLCCLELNGKSQWTPLKVDKMVQLLSPSTDSVDTDSGSSNNKLTLYGRLKKLCNNSRHTSKCRAKKITASIERMTHEIDLEFLINLYKEQKGLCAYSGLPLRFGSYLETDWSTSLERIDVMKGYTKDNVCLVCVEFNVTDQTVVTGSKYGSAGWNALKFQYFLAHIQHKKLLINDYELQVIIDIQKQYDTKKTLVERITFLDIEALKRQNVIDAIHRQKRKYVNAHEHFGHIYMITSPSGKKFIGQSYLLYHKNPATVFGHARKFGYTSLLKEAEEYGEDNMNIEVIACCRKGMLEHYQDYFIDVFDTLEPNGLNNRTKVDAEVRKRISQTLVDNAIRYDLDGTQLPKYVKYVDWKDRRGYAIISHPKCKKKDFVSKRKPLDTLKQECMTYLASLD